MVKTAASGDMIGDPCCEFEATEDELIAEAGTHVGCELEMKVV